MYLVSIDNFCHVCFFYRLFLCKLFGLKLYGILLYMISISILWCARFDDDNEVDDYHGYCYIDSDNEAVLRAALTCCILFGC